MRQVDLRVTLISPERLNTTKVFDFEQETNGSVKFRPAEPVEVELEVVKTLRLEVWDVALRRIIAVAEMETKDLEKRRHWRLLLQDPLTSEAVYGTAPRGPDSLDRTLRPLNRRPSFLHLLIQVSEPGSFVQETPSSASTPSTASRSEVFRSSLGSLPPGAKESTGRKKVMLITRGTRGDVQPFVALARGLILYHDCDVIFVTEISWRNFAMDTLKDLPEDRVRFRPCGGDTAQRVNTDLSRNFLSFGQNSVAIQALVFSRSEVEFFESEGCFYHWAWEEKPDFIVFGFLLIHVAMIISEALTIPVVGFIFQPHREIEPFLAGNALEELLGPMRQVMGGPKFIATLQQVMEKLPDKYTLRDLRLSRNLAPSRVNILASSQQEEELRHHRVPMIVPVSPVALGETQARGLEEKGMTLTDFIFLRQKEPTIDAEVTDFIQHAKSQNRKVIAMTFSSMPVGLRRILKIAVIICRDCRVEGKRPAVIAMVKGQPAEARRPEESSEEEKEHFIQKRRLLVMDKSLDFGVLFPQVDALILHGGLGVTSEALLAGKPAITSGILLMDQRYWAARLNELGCGSQGISVDDLMSNNGTTLVNLIHQALLPSIEGGSSWMARAKEVQDQIQGYRGAYVVMEFKRLEEWRAYRQTFTRPTEEYFLRDRHGQITGFTTLDERENAIEGERFPVQVLKRQVRQCEDPDGVRRNAEVIFAAGTELRAVVRDAYTRNRTCCRCVCKQTTCFLQCLRETVRFLLCLQVPACLFFWLKAVRACLCCKPLKWLFLWVYPRRTMSHTPGPMDSMDSFGPLNLDV